jgi:hypothetical protein
LRRNKRPFAPDRTRSAPPLADITRETISPGKAIEFQERALSVFARLREDRADVAAYEHGWAERRVFSPG